MELYKKYRPKSLKEVIGQDEAVKTLRGLLKKDKLPHALLLTGQSGVGKTTIARILAKNLECNEETDFFEVNCADFRGIDMVRDIRTRVNYRALSGKARIWLIDEAHKLSNDAQNAFLKLLEDTPSQVYFFLATTDPQKLLKTIQTRVTEFKLSSLSPQHLQELIVGVIVKELPVLEDRPADEVIERLIECADGSARKALVLLQQIIELEETDDQLDCLLKSDTKRQSIEIARLLIKPTSNRKTWPEVAKLLKALDDEPETIRRMVLGYANSVMLGGGKLSDRAFLIILAFEKAFYDSGKAGLTRACYEVLCGG